MRAPKNTPGDGSNKPKHPMKTAHSGSMISGKKFAIAGSIAAALAGPVGLTGCDTTPSSHVSAACDTAEKNSNLQLKIGQFQMREQGPNNDLIAGVEIDLIASVNGLSAQLEAACGGDLQLVVTGTVRSKNGQKPDTYERKILGIADVHINGNQPLLRINLDPPAIEVRNFEIAIMDPGRTKTFASSNQQPDTSEW